MTESPHGHRESFGPYTLLRELGRGGQGSVWLAEDSKLSRRFALKLLNTGPGSISDQQLARFRREAEAVSKLDHPNICGLLDAGDVDGVPYLAFRHVEGQTLADRIEASADARRGETAASDRDSSDSSDDPSSRDGIQRVVHTFEKLARALHKAHEAGLIHRDVKPGNVMINEEGEPVVLDFGLAREEIGDELSLTHSGDLIGTPAYMSPEQLMASRVPLDRRTDIYSLGASLYEALTLRRPFQAMTRAELYQQILHMDPPTASSVNRQIPRDLQVVVQTAMEKDRDRRYQTALDLAEDLRRCREFEPIRARPIGPLLRARRWAQRHPAVAVTLLLLAATSVGAVLALARISDDLKTRTMLNIVAESSQFLGVDSVRALDLAFSAYEQGPDSKESISQLHRALAHDVPIANISRGESVREIVHWSGDGRRCVTVSSGDFGALGTVQCSDAEFRAWTPRFEGRRIHGLCCGFSSSGTYLYGIDETGKLHVFDEEREQSVELDRPAEVGTIPYALAGGDRLLVLSKSRHLTLYDLESDTTVELPADLPAASSNIVMARQGPTFAVGLKGATLVVFDGERLIRSPQLPAEAVRVAYSAEMGRAVAVLGDGGAVSWELRSNSIAAVPAVEGALDAEFSADGAFLLTLHEAGVAKLRDGSGEVLHTLQRVDVENASLLLFNTSTTHKTAPSLRVTPRYFSSSSTEPRICTVYRDLATSIWDLRGEHIATIPGVTGNSWNLAEWSGDGHRLLVSQARPAIRTYDANGRLSATLAPAGIGSFSPDGSKVIGGGRLWSLPDPDVPRIAAHGAAVIDLAVDDSSRIVATASEDSTCRVWRRRPDGFELIHRIDAGAPVVAVDVDPDGDLLLLGTADGRVQLRRLDDDHVLFDAEVERRHHAFGEGLYLIWAVRIADDGRQFTVAGRNNIHVYDVKSGKRVLQRTDGSVRRAEIGLSTVKRESAVSPDETVMAHVANREIRIFERPPSGAWPDRPSATLRGHGERAGCVRFHPDGKRIVSTSNDGTARIWNIPERRELAVLEGHVGAVRSAVFVDDGERVLTTGADGTVRTWFVDNDDLIRVVRERLESAGVR